MKKDILKRVLCLACCLSLTLGMFAYRPTKAEAVFVSPAVAFGASLVASVVVATTAQFFVDSGAAETLGTAVDGFVTEFIDAASLVSEYTTDTFFEEIASGATVLEAGAIQLSESAGSLMGAFIGWLQGEKGLTAGGAGITVPVVTGRYNYLVDGTQVVFAMQGTAFNFGSIYQTEAGSHFSVLLIGDKAKVTFVRPDGTEFEEERDFAAFHVSDAQYYCLYAGSGDKTYISFRGDNYSAFNSSFVFSPSDFLFSSSGVSEITNNVVVTPNSEFVNIPQEIPEDHVFVINTDLSTLPQDDAQVAADSIMAGIAAGTLSPTVAIESQATDVPGTDTGEEDDVIAVPGADAELLDWTKYIGQKVAAIPQAIAEAVAGIFVPDAALVNQITGAFSEKFGFVETLKTIGDDLFGMTPSSEPPVVWIHLEDAEGKYYYGGTVKALDMSWFQRYKEDVDRILGGFLWVAYLWLLFRRLPDILGGAGLVIADSQYIGDGMYVDGNTGEITGRFMFRRSKRL